MRIRQEETTALIIDYQESLVPVVQDGAELVRNTKLLVEGLKIIGIPLIITTQYKKGLKDTVGEISKAAEGAEAIDKITFSCFGNEDIRRVLGTVRKNVLICGIEAHICVLQTVIDLREAGYNVVLVEDCISSRKENDKKIALRRAEAEGALLTTYEAILFELTQYAGTDKFKAISKLIK